MLETVLKRVARNVEARLSGFLDEIAAGQIRGVFPAYLDSPVLDEVRNLTLRGGKRIRAALLIHGAALFDSAAENRTAVIDSAAALELMHTYFLIHDDIMDHDEIRRGGPAVHFALGRRFDNPDLGVGLGILAGDLASALAGFLMGALELETTEYRRLARYWATMHLDVIHGQTLDVLGNADACEVARHKTASYTTVGPLVAGSILGGATNRESEHIAAIAVPLGVAFQLRDDMIGVFGNSRTTGKPVGSDLKRGKKTLLIEEARRRANPSEAKAIERVFNNDRATDEEIANAHSALETCGARAACMERIVGLTREFSNELARTPYRDEGKRFLLEVAQFLAKRER